MAPESAPDLFTAEREELEEVLTSPLFPPNATRSRMLRYICERHFAGEEDQIKEYNLAVEVLGRPADFDKKRFSVVRVEAHRLRKRLQQYYENEGREHPLCIAMSPGQYTVRFVPREEALSLASGPVVPLPVAVASGAEARTSPNYGRNLMILAGVALGVALFMLAGWLAVRTHMASPTNAGSSGGGPVSPRALPPGSAGDAVRILTGLRAAHYVDRVGRTWTSDRYYTGGTVLEVGFRPIYRGADPLLYLKPRTGEFRYDIPLSPGVYELHLLFAETVYQEDDAWQNGGEFSRVFTVLANGAPLLKRFDIISDASGPGIADTKVFRDVSPAADGFLHLEFKGLGLLNGIEIYPGTPGRMRPIRIACARRTAYTDRDGEVWEPDQYYLGGRMTTRQGRPAAGNLDPEIFCGEHWGNFSYAIPVDARGTYTVNLMFAEHFFGPGRFVTTSRDDPSKPAGAGSRVFDVLCNTRLLLKDFDIFREAGGPAIGVARTFRGLRPNAQGKLLLSFIPIAEYATVEAIEVLDEIR